MGLSPSSVRDRVQREDYHRPYRGVAVIPTQPPVGLTLAFAAALALGDGSVLTGRPALAAKGLVATVGSRPHVVQGHAVRRRRLDGVRVQRSRTLAEVDWWLAGEVRVATVERALLDVARFASQAQLRGLLIDGRQRRLLDVAELARRAGGLSQLPGRARLLAACEDVLGSGADSPLVVEVEGWLRREGFHLDVPARTVSTATRVLHPDITLSGLPIGIEVDGFGYHADRRALDLDQRKHNAYLVAGWIVLRITWDRLRHDPEGFLAELRAAIAQVAAG